MAESTRPTPYTLHNHLVVEQLHFARLLPLSKPYTLHPTPQPHAATSS